MPGIARDAARVFVSDAAMRIEMTADRCLAAMAEGDVLRTHLAALRRLLKTVPANTVAARAGWPMPPCSAARTCSTGDACGEPGAAAGYPQGLLTSNV